MPSFVNQIIKSIRPRPPFDDRSGDKGWFNRFSEAQPFEVTSLTLSIPGWETRSDPLRFAVLADLHLGSHSNDVARLNHVISEVKNQRPDIVLLLGDFMNTQIFGGGRIPPEAIAEQVGSLESRLGTYAILGNHDWHYDGLAVWRALEKHGIVVLENSAVKISDNAGDFWIVGLADDETRKPNVELAFSSYVKNEPALVLAHDPVTFADIPSGPYLTLCGHTHGGQIRLPFFGPIFNASRAPLRWTSGYIVEDDRHLFVSRGLGTSVVPFRWNCLPEVSFLTIGKAAIS